MFDIPLLNIPHLFKASSGWKIRLAHALHRLTLAALLGLTLAVAGFHTSYGASKYSGIVLDIKSGKILYEYKANTRRYPASLTKIMTIYLALEDIEKNRLSFNSRVKISKRAAGQPPSKLGLRPGASISVHDAIMSLVTKSANDIATALAERISGSEAAFARRMTATAKRLGMRSTVFKNASGLPNSRQYTTARDMARLGQAIQDSFPQYFKFFNTRHYKIGKRVYSNHNKLLGKVPGVDGIKTGYIRAAGYNLVTSVRRDGRQIVAVVLGGRSGASRDRQMTKLVKQYLPKATRRTRSTPLLVANTRLPAERFPPLRRPFAPMAIALQPMPNPSRVQDRQIRTALAPAKRGIDAMSARASTQSAGGNPSSIESLVAFAEDYRGASGNIAEDVIGQIIGPASAKKISSLSASVLNKAALTTMGKENSWKVQVGASPSRNQAEDLLAEAQKRLGRKAQQLVPFIEELARDQQTYYRARFAGYESQNEAEGACKLLRGKGFECFASN